MHAASLKNNGVPVYTCDFSSLLDFLDCFAIKSALNLVGNIIAKQSPDHKNTFKIAGVNHPLDLNSSSSYGLK